MGREEGGGFRMGNTYIPVVDSFWYLVKLIQFVKFQNKIKLKKITNGSRKCFKLNEKQITNIKPVGWIQNNTWRENVLI